MGIPHHADKSFWLSHAGDYEPSPPLVGERQVDVAIIGAGFTGLSTAYHARKADSGASVAVLEAECVAFGASGRTSGWVVPISVLDPDAAELLYGKDKLRALQDFAWDGLDYVRDLVAREKMDSDFESPGAIFTSFGGHEKKLEKFYSFWTSHPRGKDCEWYDRTQIASVWNSSAFDAGFRLPHTGQIQPVKHARELKRIAVEAGAEVFEQSPVIAIDEGATEFTLTTPQGALRAKRLIVATNGYTHLLPPVVGLAKAQLPMFIYQLMTEPLTEAQWKALGWQRRQQFYDKTRYFPPTCRTTVDGRLQFNLCDIYLGSGRNMEEAQRSDFYAAAERMFAKMFPAFAKIPIAQRWCGACSQPWDVKPQVGTLKGGRIGYAFGYSGAGVLMSQNFGRILADLALERRTSLTDLWFVAEEGNREHTKLRHFPRMPGLESAVRASLSVERGMGLRRRQRLGLD